MASPRLQAEIMPNQDVRIYHANFALCNKEQHYIQWNGDELEKRQYEELPEHARTIIDGVVGVAGVVRCNLWFDRVNVTKARMSEWSDIEPQLFDIIRRACAAIVTEEIEHVLMPIRNPKNWGLNEDGKPLPREWGI